MEEKTAADPVVLRLVRPTQKACYVSCVPFVPLKAAAGYFGDSSSGIDLDSEWGWVKVDTHRKLRPGMFVAQVVGKSMEPGIPDGAYCLFSAPVTGSRQGSTVVVEMLDGADPETGESYTVKRYESQKVTSEDGTWRHVKIILKPDNPDFQPIELNCEGEGNVKVVAELSEVLGQ
ncbi:MAG: S24 family peptidase [Deltaproteobacteria bacterium]|nr:S24 family peptidase [Deltaproteobacteria bacterium]